MNIPKGFTLALSEAYGTLLKCEKDHPLFVPLDGKVPDECHHCTYEASRTPPALEWCSRCGCGNDRYAHLESCPTQTPPAQEVAANECATTNFDVSKSENMSDKAQEAEPHSWIACSVGIENPIRELRVRCHAHMEMYRELGWTITPLYTRPQSDAPTPPSPQKLYFEPRLIGYMNTSGEFFKLNKHSEVDYSGFTKVYAPPPQFDRLRQVARALLRVLNEGGDRAKAMQDLDHELKP